MIIEEAQPVLQERPAPNANTAPATTEQKEKESVSIPTSLVRWFFYTILFQIVLVPIAVWTPLNPWCTLSIAVILAHFAGQLNKLIDK
jgi:hypothetical protein